MSAYIKDARGTYSLVHNGKNHVFDVNHPKYTDLVELLKAGDFDGIVNILNIGNVIQDWSKEGFTFKGGVLYFGNEEVDSVITSRVVEMIKEGFDEVPVLRFMKNLYDNPSKASVDELYSFMANKHLPITPDGHLLAYKAVKVYHGSPVTGLDGVVISEGDLVDCRTGVSYRNNPGDKPKMLRRQVDDNRRNECSHGLHVGAIEYLRKYYSGDGFRYVIVKINPKDVVSVPLDETCQKMRCCEYEVLGLFEAEFSKNVVDFSREVSYDEENEDEQYYEEDEENFEEDEDSDIEW